VLRSFRVANHRSIRAEQELLLLPAYNKSRPVVPVAALFGANASGKSNLLDALRFMQTAVRTSFAEWEPGAGIPRTPFRLDPAAAVEPSVYAVEVLLDGVRYSYGFEIDDERVREEWLHAYPHNRRQVIFERAGQHIHPGPTAGPARRQVTLLEELLRPNTLFLTLAARGGLTQVTTVYAWFAERLRIVLAEDRQPDEQEIITQLDQDNRDQDSGGSRLTALARAADVGIQHIATAASDVPGRRRLVFFHNSHSAPLELWEESHGTRVWLSYLTKILHCLDTGGVLVIDEIDLALHPRLTDQVVFLFRDPANNPAGAQLISTTHAASLLGRWLGEDILGRDEVWFVEKDRDGATSLYALSDFRPRKDENTERRYLTGSYGAVPALFDLDFSDAVTPRQDGAGGRVAS